MNGATLSAADWRWPRRSKRASARGPRVGRHSSRGGSAASLIALPGDAPGARGHAIRPVGHVHRQVKVRVHVHMCVKHPVFGSPRAVTHDHPGIPCHAPHSPRACRRHRVLLFILRRSLDSNGPEWVVYDRNTAVIGPDARGGRMRRRGHGQKTGAEASRATQPALCRAARPVLLV